MVDNKSVTISPSDPPGKPKKVDWLNRRYGVHWNIAIGILGVVIGSLICAFLYWISFTQLSLEFLQDPIWQFVGATLSLAAIILTFLLLREQRQDKALSYEVLANAPLLNVDGNIRERVQILLDYRPVENIHYLLLRLINTGTVPILPSDFFTPIIIEVQSDAQLLNVEVKDTDPPRVPVAFTIDRNMVKIEPLLLNGDDTISLNILTDKAVQLQAVFARIKNIREISVYAGTDPYRVVWQSITSTGIKIGLAIGGTLAFLASLASILSYLNINPF
jgi:uncharacterized membrane protein YeaQ/YmgE (transglycosylase-associated protein family)